MTTLLRSEHTITRLKMLGKGYMPICHLHGKQLCCQIVCSHWCLYIFMYLYVVSFCSWELLLRTMRRLMVRRRMKLQIFFISTTTLIVTTDITVVTMVTQQLDINTQENHLVDQLLRCNILSDRPM